MDILNIFQKPWRFAKLNFSFIIQGSFEENSSLSKRQYIIYYSYTIHIHKLYYTLDWAPE